MALVDDANVVISALIADSTTRKLLVTLEPPLLTPAVVHEEIERHEDLTSRNPDWTGIASGSS